MIKKFHLDFLHPSALMILVAIMLLFSLSLSAQKLTAESMELLPNDATASMEDFQRQDLNGNYAGVVKVMLAVNGATFEGGGVLEQRKHMDGEYWVWLAKDSKRIKVHAPGYLPLELNFYHDYKFMIESKRTYKLVLTVPSSGLVQQDDGMQYLLVNVTPIDATVKVDGKLQQNVNGVAKAILPPGTHTYEVSAVGYASKSGSVVMSTHKEEVSVRLESLMARLDVKCPTSGAQVYVNDDLMGTVPWAGSLYANYYKVEVRKDGYRSQSQTVNLSEKESRTLDFPALSAIVGRLNVDYQPMGSDVYIDGQKMGTTPDIFRNVSVGAHKVEIRKDGYSTLTRTVTVEENKQVELTGSLTAVSTPTPANNNNTAVSTQTPANSNTVTASQTSNGTSQNKTFEVKGVSFTMVYVEGGTFTMGATSEQGEDADDSEKPMHSVTLSSYYMGETEVTQELWQAVMGKNPSFFKKKGRNLPVEQVSWKDCQAFISKLNTLTGQQFKLPTEAQWEYAARGGNKSRGYKYSGSEEIKALTGTTHTSAMLRPILQAHPAGLPA